ncbi:MAG TPA: hypothetical protein VFV38_08090 [Ktedonobacteraceae bacterium]|nr:hypothetical protein [Ktedonobacteraceae bacterium]
MIQSATFLEMLRFIWKDQTSFDIYGTEQKKTKKAGVSRNPWEKGQERLLYIIPQPQKERNQRHYRNPYSLLKNGSCRDAYCSIADRRFKASKS